MNSNERRLNAGKYTVEQYDEFARYENSSILVTFNPQAQWGDPFF